MEELALRGCGAVGFPWAEPPQGADTWQQDRSLPPMKDCFENCLQ